MKREITISYGASATISQAPFENFKPSYHISEKVLLEDGESIGTNEEIIGGMKQFINKQIELDINRCKTQYLEKVYQNLRFREKDGKQYPSVTSILDFDTEIPINEDDLRQYASRGTVVDKIIEVYLTTKKWLTAEEIPELKEHLIILNRGRLKLSYEDCGYKEFFEKHGKDITATDTKGVVFNDEHLYSGEYDFKGTYEGKKAIFDVKVSDNPDTKRAFKQLSAYSKCEQGIELMVVIPLKPGNKTGFGKPVISEATDTYFKEFLKHRSAFKRTFGV